MSMSINRSIWIWVLLALAAATIGIGSIWVSLRLGYLAGKASAEAERGEDVSAIVSRATSWVGHKIDRETLDRVYLDIFSGDAKPITARIAPNSATGPLYQLSMYMDGPDGVILVSDGLGGPDGFTSNVIFLCVIFDRGRRWEVLFSDKDRVRKLLEDRERVR